jgi:hypothetical protein
MSLSHSLRPSVLHAQAEPLARQYPEPPRPPNNARRRLHGHPWRTTPSPAGKYQRRLSHMDIMS